MTSRDKIFEGLKVIELSTVLAGPAVGMFFAELGADVLKIESNVGDVTRQWKLINEDPNDSTSAYFHSVNYNKRYTNLNLSEKSDYASFTEELKSADIVISNFKPISAKRLAVDYAHVSQINPEIIYAELLAFDTDSERLGYDIVMQAETGFLSMCGTQDGRLCKLPVALIDLIAAHQLKEAILIALLQRTKTKKGKHIQVSLFDAGLTALANQASNYLNAEHIAKPIGTEHPNIAPYGEIYTSQDDQKFIIAVASDIQFQQLKKTFKLNLDTEQYGSSQLRVKHRKSLFEILQNTFCNYTLTDLAQLFESQAIPYGKIHDMKTAMHIAQERGLILEDGESEKTSKRISTIAFNFLN